MTRLKAIHLCPVTCLLTFSLFLYIQQHFTQVAKKHSEHSESGKFGSKNRSATNHLSGFFNQHSPDSQYNKVKADAFILKTREAIKE